MVKPATQKQSNKKYHKFERDPIVIMYEKCFYFRWGRLTLIQATGSPCCLRFPHEQGSLLGKKGRKRNKK